MPDEDNMTGEEWEAYKDRLKYKFRETCVANLVKPFLGGSMPCLICN